MRLPFHGIFDWYGLRWRIGRQHSHGPARLFALAELVCMSLSLATLLLLLGSALSRQLHAPIPSWLSAWLLPLLTAAAVGYLTNFVAVNMLFQPYRRGERHWTRWISLGLWKQGLISARQSQIAEAVGHQVSEHLLTPEALADEVVVFLDRTLERKGLQDELQTFLGPMLRRHLSDITGHLQPELMTLLRQGLNRAMDPERLRRFLDEVADPWLRDERNRQRLTGAIVQTLQNLVPRMIAEMQRMAGAYRSRSLSRRALLGAAEALGLIQWEEVEQTLRRHLSDPEMNQRLYEDLTRLMGSMRDSVTHPDATALVEDVKQRLSDHVGRLLGELLPETLPEMGHRVADNPRFWRWLAEEALPAARPHLASWLRRDGVVLLRERFRVGDRIRDAVEGMNVPDLHRMVDRVGAEHLGAIQVLGYLLGLAAGSLLLLAHSLG